MTITNDNVINDNSDVKTNTESYKPHTKASGIYGIILILVIAVMTSLAGGFLYGLEYAKNEFNKQMIDNIKLGAFLFNDVHEDTIAKERVIYQITKKIEVKEIITQEGAELEKNSLYRDKSRRKN